jgi:protein-L-isoaspartate(D-aspartate) O-methyltransferase
VIYFDGAVPEVPEGITSQLADGGRLVCILTGDGTDSAIVISRYGDSLSTRTVFESAAPLLPGFERKKAFVF